MGPQSSVLVVLTLTEAGTGRLLWPARSVMSGAMVLWKEPDALAAGQSQEGEILGDCIAFASYFKLSPCEW